MRVTNLMLGQNLMANLETVQDNMQKYQNQLASGRRIFQPSDDPVGVQLALSLKGAVSDNEQYQANASQGLSLLQTTDTSLQNMMQMLQRVRTLAVQGSNGSLTAADRASMASEVQQILQEIGSLGNTQVGDKYIFAGTSTTAPWKGGTTWNGNNGYLNAQVGNGVQVPVNADFTNLFSGTGSVLNVLNNFVNDLNSNTVSNFQTDLQNIDSQVQNFTEKQAEIGALTNRIQTVQQQLSQTAVSLKQNLSTVQDADIAKVVTQLTTTQNVYQAALAVGAKYIQPSLVDFLK